MNKFYSKGIIETDFDNNLNELIIKDVKSITQMSEKKIRKKNYDVLKRPTKEDSTTNEEKSRKKIYRFVLDENDGLGMRFI